MKRLFSIIIMLTCICMSTMAAEVIQVKDYSEFVAALEHHDAHIKLTGDIKLADAGKSKTSDITFSGTIDGDGGKDENGNQIIYSIIGLGTDKEVSPIFKEIQGATFTNLCIRNFRLVKDTYFGDDDNLGVLGEKATNCIFEGVLFSDISVFSNEDNAGAIVGNAISCTFDKVKCLHCDVSVDGVNAGGFVGYSENSKYYDCLNNLASGVFADGGGINAYVGGFVGYSKQDTFQYCVNMGLVCGDDDRVGGITGYSTNSNFWQCSNSGLVAQCDEEDYLSTKEKIMQSIKDYYDTLDSGSKAMFGTFFGSFGVMTLMGLGGFIAELAGYAISVTMVGGGLIVFAVGAVAAIVIAIIFNADAHDELGGICGSAEGGEFKECANYGQCHSRDSYVGGIVGEAAGTISKNIIIETCLNQGTVGGNDYVGGIVGYIKYAEISNCLTTGKLSSECSWENNTRIHGSDYGGTVSFKNNYYKADAYNAKSNEFIAVTEEQLNSGQVAWWLNGGTGSGDAPWRQTLTGENLDKYPTLNKDHDIVTADKLTGIRNITTADELIEFAEDVNAGSKPSYIVYLGNDIDMEGKSWTPIGTQEHKFIGLFFGGGHTIYNLKCNSGTSRTGIFGSIGNNTEIRDVNLGEGSYITGTNAVGGIVGCVESEPDIKGKVVISGCMNYGDIKGTYNVGGILGAQYFDQDMQLSITNCCNHGKITATNTDGQSGTISGYVKDGTVVTGCWNSGKVVGFDNGKSFVRYTNSIEIHNCYQLEDLVKENPNMGQTGVETYTKDELLNGTLCYNLNGSSNDPTVGLPWQQELGTTNGPVCSVYKDDSNGIYYTREVKSTYGTIVLPFDINSTGNMKFYRLNQDNCNESTIAFKAVDVLPAGTPALFKVAKNKDEEEVTARTFTFIGADEVFSLEPNYDENNIWNMKGNLSNTSIDFTTDLDKLYYISGDQIKSATKGLTVGGYRAYIEGPTHSSSEVKSFNFVLIDDDNEATGIQFVETNEGTTIISDKDGIYNLNGQRLTAPQKGINIIDGKKVLVK